MASRSKLRAESASKGESGSSAGPTADQLLFGAGYRDLEEEYSGLKTLEQRAKWWLTSSNSRVQSMPIATRQMLHDRLMEAHRSGEKSAG